MGALFALTLVLGAGCGANRLVATTNIPVPLVVKVPVTVALHIPKEFTEYVHTEKRWSTDWSMELGKAQSEALVRLITAMFERVIVVDSIANGVPADQNIRAILEPSVEEYAFVTPRDAGSPFYAVSVKYRMNVYSPDGKLADSWGFTGYGTSPSEGLSSTAPLTRATALAMRDAGAKLAVEFREQAIVRGLLPDSAPETPATPAPLPESAPPPASTPSTGAPVEAKPGPGENARDPLTPNPSSA
jgi:hypothetical protein